MTDKIKELKLIPSNDIRVLSSMIAPFNDDMLKEHDFKDRAEFSKAMFMSMKKYGGIGLTANQVGMLSECLLWAIIYH